MLQKDESAAQRFEGLPGEWKPLVPVVSELHRRLARGASHLHGVEGFIECLNVYTRKIDPTEVVKPPCHRGPFDVPFAQRVPLGTDVCVENTRPSPSDAPDRPCSVEGMAPPQSAAGVTRSAAHPQHDEQRYGSAVASDACATVAGTAIRRIDDPSGATTRSASSPASESMGSAWSRTRMDPQCPTTCSAPRLRTGPHSRRARTGSASARPAKPKSGRALHALEGEQDSLCALRRQLVQ